MKQTLFITGTDTGVGKTVLVALLTRFLREKDVNAVAFKPVCSGGRADARALHTVINGLLTLDEINPWHFNATVAPLLAARQEKRTVRRSQILVRIQALQKRFDLVLVEGAGGLLSPLGENFDSRDLIAALRAEPVIVAPNKLGVVNHVLLTLEALPPGAAKLARVVLMSPPRPDAASKTNAALLAEFFDAERIFSLPWLGKRFDPDHVLKNVQVRKVLRELAK